jgi:hypothetical protein
MREWENLYELNEYLINHIAKTLNFREKFIKSSELNIDGKSTDYLIKIVKAVGGDTYLSGVLGKEYLDEHKFAKNGINLIYQNFNHPQYRQLHGAFIPKMSIIDLLFNEGHRSNDIIRKI